MGELGDGDDKENSRTLEKNVESLNMSLFFLFVACTQSSLPEGNWMLSGISMEGKGRIQIRQQKVEIELYTDRFTTNGLVVAAAEQKNEMLWLYFPLQTGQGEGEAALRFQGNEAMLPLGARRGEFEIADKFRSVGFDEEGGVQFKR